MTGEADCGECVRAGLCVRTRASSENRACVGGDRLLVSSAGSDTTTSATPLGWACWGRTQNLPCCVVSCHG